MGQAITTDDLMAQARAATGLADFGDPWFMGPLAQVVALLNGEARLTAPDTLPAHTIVGYLADRLRLVDFLKKHPKALDERLQVAGVIIGLPRGGSTLAQRLVGASPQITSTHRWELNMPLPLEGERFGDPSPRIAAARKFLDDMAAAWPEMASMHPMTPTTYDEEIQFFDRGFVSIMYFFYAHLPSYSDWQWAQDHSRIYEELVLWLKVLQHQQPGRDRQKWLLKSPQHLLGGGLRTALKTFPDARFIMTHRKLDSVIASFASMQWQMVKDYTRDLDPHVLGPEAIRLFERALRDLIRVRETHPPEMFLDVQYEALVADPIGQFERTMRAMGLEVTESDLDAAKSWMAANGRDSHPRHRYSPEEFGIDRAELQQTFRFYNDRFLEPVAEKA